MKINRTSGEAENNALGPSPAVPTTGLSPAVAAVLEHLSAQAEPVSIDALAAMTGLHGNTVREHVGVLIAAGFAAKEQALTQRRGRPAFLYYPTVGTEASGAPEYAGLAAALAAHIHRTSDLPRRDGIAAGIDWGRRLAADFDKGELLKPARDTSDARSQMISLLDDLGFAPAVDADTRTTAPADTDTRTTASPDADTDEEAAAGETTTVAGSTGSTKSTGGTESAVHVRLTRCPLLSAAEQYPDIVCGVHLGLVRGALSAFGDHTSESQLEPFAEPGACRLHLRLRESSQ